MPEAQVLQYRGSIVAKPSWDYRWRRFALVIVIFVYGLYSLYDGFYYYPLANAQAHEKDRLLDPDHYPYPGLDVPFNKVFGIALPPLSLVFLGWVMYVSRGTYRFDGSTLSVPGHSDVALKAIRKIDKTKWDRKGIAYLHYQVPGSSKLGVMRLDDFIYQRMPTDKIFEQVEAAVEAAKTPANLALAPVMRIVCGHCGVQNLSTSTTCSSCGGALDVKDLVSRE